MSEPSWTAVESQPKRGDNIAPVGAVWVCAACGKTSRDLYGDERSSWDESCAMNAVLCYAKAQEK